MSILFLGDLAIPSPESINIDDVKEVTKSKIVIANLEGPITDETNNEVFDRYKYNLFTSIKCLKLLKSININFLSLANNHILDFKQPLKTTISLLKENHLDYFGTYNKPYIEFTYKDKRICLWGVMMYITGSTSNKYDRLNEFKPYQTLNKLRKYKLMHPEAYLIIYIHWGFELAKYPQPADREWAFKAIDAGVDAVIGHHPHVVQGVEKYKNGIIVYSLGNFILPQVEYSGQILSYNTPRVNFEIGLEINPFNNEIKIHDFFYDKENSKLFYKGNTFNSDNNKIPYLGFSNEEYREWYKKHKHEGEHKPVLNFHPKFNSYFCFQNIKFHFYKYFYKIFRFVRSQTIRYGMHMPYNWKK